MKDKHSNIDWTAIFMSLIACVFAWSIGNEELWNRQLVSIVLPLVWIYLLLPYIVRLYVQVVDSGKK